MGNRFSIRIQDKLLSGLVYNPDKVFKLILSEKKPKLMEIAFLENCN